MTDEFSEGGFISSDDFAHLSDEHLVPAEMLGTIHKGNCHITLKALIIKKITMKIQESAHDVSTRNKY